MVTQQLVLKSNDLFYLGESVSDGMRDRAAGLYARDTRFLNQIRLSLGGVRPETLSTTVHHASAATITSANNAMALSDGRLLHPHLVAVEQRITVDTSLHIAIALQNFSQEVISLDLQLLFDADFHDVFEIRGFKRESTGAMLEPRLSEGAIHFRYRASDNRAMGTVISFDRQPQIQLQHRTESAAEALVSLLPGSDEVHWESAPDHLAGVLASFP
ncbi:MAG: glycogen debranching N-terminal domain-containing protein, partial [Thermomicrobiales bacterium]